MRQGSIFASIITIGDELLIGQTIDTNSAFISQELNKIGIWVRRRIAVGDVADDIRKALDEESGYSQIIIMTGGLGPTADDITKPLLCDYFNGKLVINEQVLNHIKYLFEKVFLRQGPLLESNLKQAEVPDNCTVLFNKRGTAPGMLFEKYGKLFISLPGVPHEMKGLMLDEVLPRILKVLKMPVIAHRTAFTAGLGESMIADLLKEFEPKLPPHIKLAYLPNYGMVKLRLTAIGSNASQLEKKLNPLFKKMMGLVKDYLVSNEDKTLEEVIGNILKEKNKTLSTAESCTGGYIAHLITSIPGSSSYFKGTVVSYANEVKENLLEVPAEILQTKGAVSEETVIQMVKGVLKILKSDYALATSGIMGPDGGSEDKPVGTVWIAVGDNQTIKTIQLNLRFDRQRNIAMTATNALNFLRKFILEAA